MMNLQIRIRYVHLLYTEKELKVLLVSTKPDSYTLPQGLQPEIAQALKNVHNHEARLRDHDRHFPGLINRVPNLMQEKNGQHLAFDFYLLTKPDIKLNHLEDHTWFSLQEVTELNSDLSQLIGDTLRRLKEELNYQPIEYHLLPRKFTIPELRRLYELILDRKLDRANFFRKITVLDIIKAEGLKKKGKSPRAPMLYTFNENYFQKVRKGLFKEF